MQSIMDVSDMPPPYESIVSDMKSIQSEDQPPQKSVDNLIAKSSALSVGDVKVLVDKLGEQQKGSEDSKYDFTVKLSQFMADKVGLKIVEAAASNAAKSVTDVGTMMSQLLIEVAKLESKYSEIKNEKFTDKISNCQTVRAYPPFTRSFESFS